MTKPNLVDIKTITFFNEINKNIRLTKEVVRNRMNIFIKEV